MSPCNLFWDTLLMDSFKLFMNRDFSEGVLFLHLPSEPPKLSSIVSETRTLEINTIFPTCAVTKSKY